MALILTHHSKKLNIASDFRGQQLTLKLKKKRLQIRLIGPMLLVDLLLFLAALFTLDRERELPKRVIILYSERDISTIQNSQHTRYDLSLIYYHAIILTTLYTHDLLYLT